MFAGTAEGQILSPTLSTRAQICGIPGVVVVQKKRALNQTKSGWFDTSTFDDWF